MAGTGGQGLIFLASFMSEAAMLEGKNVAQTQSYGTAQRGGFISAEVIIDAEEILFQQVTQPDVIVALNECVGSRYDNAAAPVLYDSSLMAKRDLPNWHGIPFTQIAHELGSPRSANLVAIGAIHALLPFTGFESLEAIARKRNAAAAETSLQAMRKGMEAAQQFVNSNGQKG